MQNPMQPTPPSSRNSCCCCLLFQSCEWSCLPTAGQHQNAGQLKEWLALAASRWNSSAQSRTSPQAAPAHSCSLAMEPGAVPVVGGHPFEVPAESSSAQSTTPISPSAATPISPSAVTPMAIDGSILDEKDLEFGEPGDQIEQAFWDDYQPAQTVRPTSSMYDCGSPTSSVPSRLSANTLFRPRDEAAGAPDEAPQSTAVVPASPGRREVPRLPEWKEGSGEWGRSGSPIDSSSNYVSSKRS